MRYFGVLILGIGLVLSGYTTHAQRTAFELNKALGRGINMGNMFEAPTETAWGNPYRADYFQRIRTLGFQHVRIPVRWDTPERTSFTEPYRVDQTFLNRLRLVVDEALRQDLHVIINMHHHDELFSNPTGAKPRFLAQWRQIADYFKGYDQRLLFEVLNEPHDQLTPTLWNEFFAEALQQIRVYSPTRAVLMGAPLFGGLAGVPFLQLPDDNYLIVSPHFYNPFRFTHQGAEWVGEEAQSWLGTAWRDLSTEREVLIQEFEPVLAFQKQHNVPIHIGEFGAYSTADLASRVRWTTFLARWFESQGFSWAYWEFSAGFGIFNPVTNQYVQPLVDALLSNPLPQPVEPLTTVVYSSDDAYSGWNVYVNSGAEATRSTVEGQLRIQINKKGTEDWHVQVVKGNIPLQKDVLYRVRFKAVSSAASPHPVTVYTGRSVSPWDSYSGYSRVEIGAQEKEYAIMFDMKNETDLTARLVLDAGSTEGLLSVRDVVVEQVWLDVDVLTSLPAQEFLPPVLYPLPATDLVTIVHGCLYDALNVYDARGLSVFDKKLSKDLECKVALDVRNWPAGQYYFYFISNEKTTVRKFIKY
ncbi:cellulase family glycosylhydrolase [Arundinibacter roseus]|uniref:Glycoside hydrolase n=1 Tax=Arundinibacter roseus TaxID=2070510 RepID=A0A4R4KCW6_9BACT|nr:cellulase family glycosylhydrolase [Arundinibacter roseus]TDB64159.1 glycoside hydrolase [Arundinibacter roseus]